MKLQLKEFNFKYACAFANKKEIIQAVENILPLPYECFAFI